MKMAGHALPQNACYFASASMWQKAIYILHSLCKLTTTLQQRPAVQLCSQSGHHTVTSSVIVSANSDLQYAYCEKKDFVILNSC